MDFASIADTCNGRHCSGFGTGSESEVAEAIGREIGMFMERI